MYGGTGSYEMKCHPVVVVFWLVVGRWVGRVSEPTAGCVLRSDRWPWKERQAIKVGCSEEGDFTVLSFVYVAKHFLTVCDFGFHRLNIFGYIETQHLQPSYF